MTKVNINVDNNNFPDLIHKVTESGERIVIEQQGKATAAIITYDDLKRLEALEASILKKAELEEYELLTVAMKNSDFDFLKDQEDIYTLADGKPFHDPEYAQSVVSEPDFCSITEPEEDIYTLADGKLFHD
ncbi:prevent-host-death protein [Scytonema hofmannii PCC 7110]|uniref:Antitoxin n=1 Tax=Scytonema hofmannii PCC 7110 TaxID=128403 RepID=A0A139X0Z8_9CYAN|nr:type II toxin-antitoxin system Phd/YefM family antitoxin [Scytonema hofmannii]KYC38389.1 prevent-host-death protein [Scytonema hofmannii PCC 7110]